jgi:hypothetical protein
MAMAIIELSEDGRPAGLAVELLLELGLDQAAFLLHDHDLAESVGKARSAGGLQGPGHADLVDAKPELARLRLRDVQVVQRLQHVEVALPVRDDAQLRGGAIDDRSVDGVGAGERPHGRELVTVQPSLLGLGRVGLAEVQAIRRPFGVIRQDDADAFHVDVDRSGGFHGVLDALHAHPAPAVARQRPAEEAEVQDFLDAGGT